MTRCRLRNNGKAAKIRQDTQVLIDIDERFHIRTDNFLHLFKFSQLVLSSNNGNIYDLYQGYGDSLFAIAHHQADGTLAGFYLPIFKLRPIQLQYTQLLQNSFEVRGSGRIFVRECQLIIAIDVDPLNHLL